MKQFSFYLLLTSMVLVLCSCSLFGPVKTPIAKNYALSMDPNTRIKKSQSPTVLLVTTPSANPGYETADIVYVEKPYQLDKFATNHWIAPPTDMLLPLLTQNLQSTGCFHAVVSSPTSSLSDMTLNTQLLMLRQDFSGTQSRVRMTLQATVINNATSKVIASQRFSATVSASSNTPYAGVLAANQATKQILTSVNTFVCHAARLPQEDKAS